jgi:PKD repeat protein
MTRNREFFRWMNLARTSPSNPLEAERPQRPRRALRRLGLAAALAAAGLVAAQVVLAVPPANVSFTVEPSSPTRGQVVTFTASPQINDPDGGTITSYDWTFGDGTTASGPSPSVEHTYPNSTPAGEKTVTLKVTDSSAETTEVSQPVQVVNVAPTAAVSCSPSTVSPNQGTTCNSTGSGDTEGLITYAWDIDGDGFDDGTDASEVFFFAEPGTKTIRLQVTDSDDATDTAEQNVTVNPANQPPAASFTISPNPAAVGQTVIFDGSGSSAGEPGDTITSYEWDLDGNGSFETNTGNSPTTSRSYSAAGSVDVKLRVTDSANNTAVATTPDLIVGNTAPTASFTITPVDQAGGAPNVADVNETVNFDGSGSSAGETSDTIIRYEWDLDGNGSFETNTGSNPSASRSYSTPGTMTIRLRVTDSANEVSPASTRQLRVNGPPEARIGIAVDQPLAGQNPEIPLVDQAVLIHGTDSRDLNGPDPDGPVTYAWAFDLDNDGSYETNGGTAVGAALNNAVPKFSTPGPKGVRLVVTDSDGATNVATRTFRVNTPPVPRFTFEPRTPAVNEPIQFFSTSSDADGSVDLPLVHAWDFDGNGTTDSTVQNPSHAFDTPGNKSVTLKVTDRGGITEVFSRDVLVRLTVPNGAFSVSPTWPLPGEPVTFTSSSSPSEASKQITNTEWDFDYDRNTGDFTPDATGPSVSHSFPTAGVKTFAIRVTESPAGDVDIEPGTVTVNAPPQAGFVASPGEAFVGDGVTLSSTSADPDDRLVRQDWDLDNDGQFDDASAQVVSANFTGAGTYPLALRVTDSRGATSTATGQVVIRTRPIPPLPPTPPTPLLSGVLIELQGQLRGKFTKVRRLLVRAPAGSKIAVRCLGKRCPKLQTKQSKGAKKKMRFKKLERRFPPKTKLIVSVTKDGFIGKQTRWTMRRRKAPLRQDLCLNPGAKKATACPS